MKHIHSFISIVFIAIAISACSIQKRVYLPGNYVCWNKKAVNRKGVSDSKLIQKKQIKVHSIEADTVNKLDITDSSLVRNNFSDLLSENRVKILPPNKAYTKSLTSSTSTSFIQPIKKISRINPPQNHQTKTDRNPYFSLFVLCLVFAILTSITFYGLLFFGLLAFIFHKISKIKHEPKALAKHGFGVAGFILGIISFIAFFFFFLYGIWGLSDIVLLLGLAALITSILSIVFGIIAIKRNKIKPEECKGKGLAIVGLFFGIITFIWCAILAAFLLNLFVLSI